MHTKSIKRRKLVIAAAATSALLAAAVLILQPWSPGVAQDVDTAHARGLSNAFRQAAHAALPTVVKIRTYNKVQTVQRGTDGPRGENPFKGTPFEDFFDDQDMFRDFRGFRQFTPQPRDGLGTGVIIGSDGVILTNNHVVRDADEVFVTLSDGRQFKATDIKTDRDTDLAVLRIDAKNLPAARLGDSDALEIGDWVIAVGHPFELEATVSAGIISGKARALRSVGRAEFLQTDAAINPGNSGGPLVNLDGEVIGINTAIATNNGGYQGIGFAVPVNLAKWVASQLNSRGRVQRAFLGVGIGEMTPELARQFGVRLGQGVLVSEVHPDTPAAAAGFREGDLILDFNGRPVRTPRELQTVVERSEVDGKHRVRIIRDGRQTTLQVALEALPEDLNRVEPTSRELRSEPDEPASFNSKELGFEVTELSADVASRLGYEGFRGVLISNVDVNSLAYRRGLREGMLILKVNRQTVESVEQFRGAVESRSLKDGILLLARTPRGGNRYVVIEEFLATSLADDVAVWKRQAAVPALAGTAAFVACLRVLRV